MNSETNNDDATTRFAGTDPEAKLTSSSITNVHCDKREYKRNELGGKEATSQLGYNAEFHKADPKQECKSLFTISDDPKPKVKAVCPYCSRIIIVPSDGVLVYNGSKVEVLN